MGRRAKNFPLYSHARKIPVPSFAIWRGSEKKKREKRESLIFHLHAHELCPSSHSLSRLRRPLHTHPAGIHPIAQKHGLYHPSAQRRRRHSLYLHHAACHPPRRWPRLFGQPDSLSLPVSRWPRWSWRSWRSFETTPNARPSRRDCRAEGGPSPRCSPGGQERPGVPARPAGGVGPAHVRLCAPRHHCWSNWIHSHCHPPDGLHHRRHAALQPQAQGRVHCCPVRNGNQQLGRRPLGVYARRRHARADGHGGGGPRRRARCRCRRVQYTRRRLLQGAQPAGCAQAGGRRDRSIDLSFFFFVGQVHPLPRRAGRDPRVGTEPPRLREPQRGGRYGRAARERRRARRRGTQNIPSHQDTGGPGPRTGQPAQRWPARPAGRRAVCSERFFKKLVEVLVRDKCGNMGRVYNKLGG